MKDSFNVIYDDLYADYFYNSGLRYRLFSLEEYDIARIIRRAIDKSNYNDSLRSDAKYFLLVNFHHLVAKPIIENFYFRNRESVISLEDLKISIETDIQLIINTSIKTNSGFEDVRNSISGHVIISTIDTLWNELSTMKFEIWG